MEISALGQLLESLCHNSSWSYAVFWELQQSRDQMVLIYEDSYFDYESLQLSYQTNINFDTGMGGICNYGLVRDLCGGDAGGCPVAFAIDLIPGHQYLLGEGLVGRVALSEQELWLYSDDLEVKELWNDEQHPSEWLLPIIAGIKTTLMVPVSPYGVLQLCSFDKVAKSLPRIAKIKDLISGLKCRLLPKSNYGQDYILCSSILMPERENTESFDLLKNNQSPDTESVDNTVSYEETLASYEITLPFAISCDLTQEDITTVSVLTSHEDESLSYVNFSIEPDMQIEFSVTDVPVAHENSCMFYTEDEHFDAVVSFDSSTRISDDFYGQVEQSLYSEYVSTCNDKLFNLDCQAAWGLHDQLYSGFSTRNDGFNYCSTSLFDDEKDQDCLLEAVVPTSSKSSDEIFSDICNSGSSEGSLNEIASTFQVCNSREEIAVLVPTETEMASPKNGETLLKHQSTSGTSMTLPFSMESEESIKHEHKNLIDCDYGMSCKSAKSPKFKKDTRERKSKLRPRPRDRQLIQDRLTQLRKLVPDGAKCSIDGLLEHTTKHMLFLKRVAEQAEKVRLFTEQQPSGNANSTVARPPCHKSSAHQVGDKTESCPIVVTDMEHHGQFLIQMLCASGDVYFDMIEVMHQLNLTILQGVMETQSTNCARFIVEASEGFNKLDIFWPLMRILQKNGDWATNMR